jgi:hypothetical protein
MKTPELFTTDGTTESLSTMFYKNNCSIVAIQDAIEESRTGGDLAERLNKLKLFSKFQVDRETPEYVRLITVDCWGNTHYLKAWK